MNGYLELSFPNIPRFCSKFLNCKCFHIFLIFLLHARYTIVMDWLSLFHSKSFYDSSSWSNLKWDFVNCKVFQILLTFLLHSRYTITLDWFFFFDSKRCYDSSLYSNLNRDFSKISNQDFLNILLGIFTYFYWCTLFVNLEFLLLWVNF